MLSMMVGPTDVPKEILDSMYRRSISHRSAEYEQVQTKVQSGLQVIFGTEQEVLLLTSSGTGAMEATIVNLFSPGDEVVVAVIGVFSEQYAAMCEAFGLKTHRISVEVGRAVTPEQVSEALTERTKGVFIIHNEKLHRSA